MKTQSNKLTFSKNSITELTDSQSIGVNGGCQWSYSSGQNVSFIKTSFQNPNDNDSIIKL